MSEEETKELLKGVRDLNDLENKYKLLKATGKDEKEKEKLEKDIQNLRRDLINLESSLQTVYQHTADAKAERETLVWYIINLTKVIGQDGKPKDYFYFLNHLNLLRLLKVL